MIRASILFHRLHQSRGRFEYRIDGTWGSIENDELWANVEWTDALCDFENFNIGKAFMGQLKFQVFNLTYFPVIGDVLNLHTRVTLDGEYSEWVKVGTYIIHDKPNFNANTKRWEYECFNKMWRLQETLFTGNNIHYSLAANLITQLTGIKFAYEYFNGISNAYVVNLSEPKSCRAVLAYMAASLGGNARCNADGEIVINKLNDGPVNLKQERNFLINADTGYLIMNEDSDNLLIRDNEVHVKEWNYISSHNPIDTGIESQPFLMNEETGYLVINADTKRLLQHLPRKKNPVVTGVTVYNEHGSHFTAGNASEFMLEVYIPWANGQIYANTIYDNTNGFENIPVEISNTNAVPLIEPWDEVIGEIFNFNYMNTHVHVKGGAMPLVDIYQGEWERFELPRR